MFTSIHKLKTIKETMLNPTRLLALTLASLALPTQAWWGTPHMLVARIAERKLESQSPEVLQAVTDVLSQSDFATYLHLEGNHPLVECSTFAD